MTRTDWETPASGPVKRGSIILKWVSTQGQCRQQHPQISLICLCSKSPVMNSRQRFFGFSCQTGVLSNLSVHQGGEVPTSWIWDGGLPFNHMFLLHPVRSKGQDRPSLTTQSHTSGLCPLSCTQREHFFNRKPEPEVPSSHFLTTGCA